MYNFSVSEIKQLANETTGSIKEAKNALELCEDYEVAKEFLNLYHTAVCRYKIADGNKVRFTEKDFVELAKKNVEEQFSQDREDR